MEPTEKDYLDDKQWTLRVSDGRDIRFVGRPIGYGEYIAPSPRDSDKKKWHIRITILRTVGGKYIVMANRNPGIDDGVDEDTHVVYDSAKKLLDGLTLQGGRHAGRIPTASKIAWDEACRRDLDLKAIQYDVIE